MIKFFSNLFGRGTQVKTETVDSANSALRVGSLFEDLAKATAMKWDPNGTYEAGQVVYFNDLRSEAVLPTAAGESPITHPLKWSVKAVTSEAQITSGNNLLVTAGAVRDAIVKAIVPPQTVPVATTTLLGKVRKASDAEVNEGVVDDAYVSPKQQHDQLGNLLEDFVKPTLQSVTEEGATTTVSPIFLGSVETGNANPRFRHVPGGVSGFPVETLSLAFRGFYGLDAEDKWFFLQHSKVVVEFDEEQIDFNTDVIAAQQADAYFKTLNVESIRLIDNPSQAVMAVFGKNKFGQPQVQGLTLSQLATEMRQQGVGSVSLPGSARPVAGPILCRDAVLDTTPTIQHGQNITVENPTIGSVFFVSHSLNRTDLWASSKSLNDALVQIENAGQVSIYIPTGNEGLTEFNFKLEPKNALF